MTQWETIGDPPQPLRTGRWAAACTVVALVAGFLIGVNNPGTTVAGIRLGPQPALAAGPVRRSASDEGAVAFLVPVHNGGGQAVRVGVASLAGWPALRRTPAVRVPARAWAEVPVEPAAGCTGTGPPPESVRLRVQGRDEPVAVRLPEEPRVLAEYAEVACAPLRSLRASTLPGVWLVDQAYGRWTALAGSHVLVFRRDGRLVADPVGVRFTTQRGVHGTYRLSGDRLIAAARGFVGYACLPGRRAVWLAGLLPDGRVTLRFVRGRGCPDQRDEWWVLRRLDDAPR